MSIGWPKLKFQLEEVIQWVFKTRRSSVMIVKMPLLSALRNKKLSKPEAILTIPSVAPHAARKGKHGNSPAVATAMEMMAIASGLAGKCFPQYAPNAEKLPRFHSSLAKIDRYIAATATIRSGRADHASLPLKTCANQVRPACVCHFNKYYAI